MYHVARGRTDVSVGGYLAFFGVYYFKRKYIVLFHPLFTRRNANKTKEKEGFH